MLDRRTGPTSRIMEIGRVSASRPDARATRRSRPIDRAVFRESDQLLDERSIVDAVLAGDRDAYRHLVERESTSVVRACHRILGSLPEAEDAAQEAFVTAYRALGSWRGDGPFGAWLTRIAVRIALRQVGQRRSVTWLEPGGLHADGAVDAGTAVTDTHSMQAMPHTDPAAIALRAERESDLRMAVATLPEPYREVVTLRFFGELSLEEIARVTERPLATVKTHLRRGLLRLRATVEPGSGL